MQSINGYLNCNTLKTTQNKWLPKLQYVKDDSKIRHAEEGKQWTAGVDYVFDKQTTAYLFYTDLDLELESDNSVALGLKYKF